VDTPVFRPVSLTADELQELIEKIVMAVWKNKAMPQTIDKALVNFFASEFWKAVVQGYEMSLEDADFDTPDYNMLQKLGENVYQFSMAKSYAQVKAISQALINEEGVLRSFTQFRTEAAKVVNEFVNVWLRAEYNFAVASAQSASQWQTIQEDKEMLPLLKYITAGDERVRLQHQEIEDVVRPVDDAFWDVYYPPNGWNCRCDVIQMDSGTMTPLHNISLPDIKPLFMYNPGKKGFAFPPGHPYYDGLPQELKTEATKLWNERNGKSE
jgi:SPP1 gp7 family putative phage head morphogenesis protein